MCAVDDLSAWAITWTRGGIPFDFDSDSAEECHLIAAHLAEQGARDIHVFRVTGPAPTDEQTARIKERVMKRIRSDEVTAAIRAAAR